MADPDRLCADPGEARCAVPWSESLRLLRVDSAAQERRTDLAYGGAGLATRAWVGALPERVEHTLRSLGLTACAEGLGFRISLADDQAREAA